MAEDVVQVAIDGAIATMTINRPDKLNALNAAVRREFVDALQTLEAAPAVRVVIVTGSGAKAFVAGADISEFAERSAVEQFRVMQQTRIFSAVEEFSKPIIAAVNGFCLGGGCELALACDMRIASEGARFGQPEINLGLLPGGGGTQRLARLVGLGHAYRMIYSGELISAQEALRIGLIEEVVFDGTVMTRARELASVIARKSPLTLQFIKQAIRASVRGSLDEGLRFEQALLALAFASDDMREGVAAFLSKRQPTFTGR